MENINKIELDIVDDIIMIRKNVYVNSQRTVTEGMTFQHQSRRLTAT